MEEKFARVMAEPPDAPLPQLTKREAIYFLKHLAGSDPKARRSADVLREFWGEADDVADAVS